MAGIHGEMPSSMCCGPRTLASRASTPPTASMGPRKARPAAQRASVWAPWALSPALLRLPVARVSAIIMGMAEAALAPRVRTAAIHCQQKSQEGIVCITRLVSCGRCSRKCMSPLAAAPPLPYSAAIL